MVIILCRRMIAYPLKNKNRNPFEVPVFSLSSCPHPALKPGGTPKRDKHIQAGGFTAAAAGQSSKTSWPG
jgi:hypothetical protein